MNLKKIVVGVLAITLVVGLSLSGGCTAKESEPPTAGLTIIDDAGRIVTIPKDPQRIICAGQAWSEILYAIGCGDRVVGVDDKSEYPPEVKDKPKVGIGQSLNLEKVLGLEPDLAIVYAFHPQNIDNLEKLGIPVVGIYAASVADVLDTIRLLGLITGNTAEAAEVTAEMQRKIDEITAKIATANLTKAQRPLVYSESTSPFTSHGPGSWMSELIFMAGGINLAADEPVKNPILTSEYIIERNPDVILAYYLGSSIEEVKARSGWEDINAVKNDRVYSLHGAFTRTTPRIVIGLEQYAKWFHPDLFGE